jgi:hypothetical protein
VKQGRGRKHTSELICQALEESHGLITVAAKRLGMLRTSLHRRIQRTPKLREYLDVQVELTLDVSELKLLQAIQKGEPWAIKFHLATKGRKRGYQIRDEHDQIQSVMPYTWEELKEHFSVEQLLTIRKLIQLAQAKQQAEQPVKMLN